MSPSTAFWIALILAAFTIAFGTRHLDAAEHHQGMVAAIAFESLVKLLAFLAVGVFVTFGVYQGFGDLFARVAAEPRLAAMLTPLEGVAGGYASWVWLTILSMMAIMFLPRQFQVAVIENLDERHLAKAIWLFPLYMLAINVFVLPIAFGGLLRFPGGSVDADTFVLTLPMAEKQEALALLVFIGGLFTGLAWIINSYATSLTGFYVGAAVGGVGVGCVYATCVNSAIKWFPDRRGLAVGLTAGGFGAGSALTILPIANTIASSGYQAAFFWFGLIQGSVILVASLALRAPQAAGAGRPD